MFKEIFNLTGEPDRVSAVTWNAVTSVYDDLYTGNRAASGQYPGYDIS